MAISGEDIAKAAREAAISVVKPTPCVCGLGSWYAALHFRQVEAALVDENEKEFVRILPDLQERLDRLKDYCSITVNTAQLYLKGAEISVKEGKWSDALNSSRKAFWAVDRQLTIGVAKEIKETK